MSQNQDQTSHEFKTNLYNFIEKISDGQSCLGVVLGEQGINSMLLINANMFEVKAMIKALMISDHDMYISIRGAVIEFEQQLSEGN